MSAAAAALACFSGASSCILLNKAAIRPLPGAEKRVEEFAMPKRVVSTYLFSRQRLHTSLLERLAQVGVQGIELFCARHSFDYRDEVQVEAVANWVRQSGVELHSLHSPMYGGEGGGRGEPPLNIAHPDRRQRSAALEEIERALDLADRVAFRYFVQHLGIGREESSQAKFDAAFTSIERLRILARQRGVTLLLENIPNALATPGALEEFLTATHLDDLGVCLDSGHANLTPGEFGSGGVMNAWKVLRARVRSTHLHDNRGERDEHLWPGEGTVAWAELIPAMGDDIPWVLEIEPQGDDLEQVLGQVRRSFQRLEEWRSASLGKKQEQR